MDFVDLLLLKISPLNYAYAATWKIRQRINSESNKFSGSPIISKLIGNEQ